MKYQAKAVYAITFIRDTHNAPNLLSNQLRAYLEEMEWNCWK